MTKRTEPQREWGLTEDQHNMVTDVVATWRGKVDDLTAQLAAKQERIRELTERCESIFGNERYFDGLSETELEFYSQMSPIEMFRSMLRKDKRIAEIEAERDEWRQRHAECTTALITADRRIASLEQLEQQLDTASHNAKHYADLSFNLEQQLAQQGEWMPVPDGIYQGFEVNADGNEIITTTNDVHGIEWDANIILPDNVRLCRRKEQSHD